MAALGINMKETKDKSRYIAQKSLYELFDALDSIVLVMDDKGLVRYLNRKGCDLLGCDCDDLISQSWFSSFIPPDARDRAWQDHLALVNGTRGSFDTEYKVVSKDHKEKTVGWHVSRLEIDDGKISGIIGIGKDITKRRRVEVLLDALVRINDAVNSHHDLFSIIDIAAQTARDTIQAESVVVLFKEDDRWIRKYMTGAKVSGLGQKYTDGEAPLSVIVTQTKRPLAVEDAQHDPRSNTKLMASLGVRSSLVVPLYSGNTVYGTILFNYISSKMAFTQSDIEFADRLGTSLSLALDNASLLKDLTEEISDRERAELAKQALLEQVEEKNRMVEHIASELKSERDLLKAIMENTEANLAYLDSDFNFILVNSTYAKGSGYPASFLQGRNHFDLFPHPENEAIFRKVRDSGVPMTFKAKPFVNEKLKGRGITYWDWTLIPIFRSGRVSGLVLSLYDVTDQVKAKLAVEKVLREKEVLLKEIHHRVKNNLQIITSLLRLQASDADSPTQKIILESQNRIRSIALVHEILYQSQDFEYVSAGDYLARLIEEIFSTFNVASGIEIKSEIEDLHLEINTIIPLGLIINELIINSVKHAFPQGRGSIGVELKSDDGSYALVVRDDGKGMPEDFSFSSTKSLGLKLVRTLTEQLDGRIELIKGGKGTTVRLVFPKA